MPKLTDTQRAILAAAANRADGAALPLPSSLRIKGGAVTTTLDSLRKKGLLEEKSATADAAVWREDKDGQRTMLVLTDAGRQTLGAAPAQGVSKSAAAKARPKAPGKRAMQKKPGARAAQKKPTAKPKARTAPPKKRTGTKQALVIELLERKDGATIAEIVKATGWQPHSVRGAISGTLKKKLGLAVTSAAVEGRGRVYRIS